MADNADSKLSDTVLVPNNEEPIDDSVGTGTGTGTQKPTPVGGNFASSLKSAKKKVSVASIKGGIKKGVTQAVTAVKDKINSSQKYVVSGQRKGEVLVCGELVRIDETDFIQGRYADTVSFSKKYFPDATGSTLEEAKDVFSRIFDINTDTSKNNFLPPCNDKERILLLSGLSTRRETLYYDLQQIQAERGDTVRLRARLELYERLNIFIQELQVHVDSGHCGEYNANGGPAGFKKINLGLEDQMHNLLRQFAFLTLQAKMEVPEYADVTNEAKEIITAVTANKIGKDEMNEYLRMWREQAAQMDPPQNIPRAIVEVLNGIEEQPGLIERMVDDELTSLFTEIVRNARKEYSANPTNSSSASQLVTQFDTYIADLERQNLKFKDKLITLITWIVRHNKECWDTLSKLQGEESVGTRQLQDNSTKLAELQRELAQNQEQLKESQRLYNESLTKNSTLQGDGVRTKEDLDKLTAEYAAYKDAQARVLATAQQEMKAKEDQGPLKQSLIDLQARITTAEAAAVAAQAANETTERTLADQRETTALVTRERDSLKLQLNTLKANTAAAQTQYTAAQRETIGAADQVTDLADQLAIVPFRGGGEHEHVGGGPQEDEISQLRALLTEAETKLQQQVTNMEQTGQQLQNAVAQEGSCQIKIKEIQTKLDTTIQANQQASKDVVKMKGEVDSLTTLLNASMKDVAARDEYISNAQKDTEALKVELKSCRDKIIELEGELATARAQISTDNERAVSQMSSTSIQLVDMRSKFNNLQLEYNNQKQLHAGEISNLRDEVATLEIQVSKLNAKVAELSAKLATAEVERDNLKEQLSKTSNAVSGTEVTLTNQLDSLNRDIELLQTTKMDAEKRAERAASQLRICEAKIPVLEKNLNRAQQNLQMGDKKMADFLLNMKIMSDDISTGREFKVPSGVAPDAGAAFKELYAKVKNVKTVKTVESSGSGSGSLTSVSCFLNYFVSFFIKVIFFSQTESQRRGKLFGMFETLTNMIFSAVQPLMPGKSNKDVLHKIMDVMFDLIKASETLFINKQNPDGAVTTADDIGLNVIKTSSEDAEATKILEVIYTIFKQYIQTNTNFMGELTFLEQTLFKDLLIKLPTLYFNKPIAVKEQGKLSQEGMDLVTFPSFTYLPNGPGVMPVLKERFQIIDVNDDYSKKLVTVNDIVSDPVTQEAWKSSIILTAQDATLQYSSIFIGFIMLGRKYLLEAKDELATGGCKVNRFLESPTMTKEEVNKPADITQTAGAGAGGDTPIELKTSDEEEVETPAGVDSVKRNGSFANAISRRKGWLPPSTV